MCKPIRNSNHPLCPFHVQICHVITGVFFPQVKKNHESHEFIHDPGTVVNINPPLYYLLGDPSFGDRGANIHPLSSLVSDQLFTPCFLTLPNPSRRHPRFMLHVYRDDIRTSATLSDTISAAEPAEWRISTTESGKAAAPCIQKVSEA
jgi:hypothetical protein